jgi:hypothetical protein
MTPADCLVKVVVPFSEMLVCPTPAPCNVIALATDRPDQEQLPAGTVTVSPDEAELIALFTSFWEQLAAFVCASAPMRAVKRSMNENHFASMAMGEFLSGKTVFSQSLTEECCLVKSIA